MYENGFGVTQSISKALGLYKMALQLDPDEAIFNKNMGGVLLKYYHNKKAAMIYLKKAADLGDEDAQAMLAGIEMN